MDSNSTLSGRSKLKTLFSNGHQVTAGDFASLIDSTVNEADDKLARKTLDSTGDSICIASGSIGSLISFLKSLDQDQAEWVVRLNQDDGSLEIRTPKGIDPILRMGKDGRVGVSTDKPEADLHVNGSFKADSMTLKETLDVQDIAVNGTLTVSKLIVNGVEMKPTPVATDPTSGSGAPNASGADGKVAAGDPKADGSKDPVANPTDKNAPAGNPGILSGLSGNLSNADKALQSKVTPPGPPASPPNSGTAPADGKWHTIASRGQASGTGNVQAYQVVAMVQEIDNGCVIHASAVNIDGDASSGAINTALSYNGSTSAKLSLRWYSSKPGIAALQIKSNSSSLYSSATKIKFAVTDQLPADWRS